MPEEQDSTGPTAEAAGKEATPGGRPLLPPEEFARLVEEDADGLVLLDRDLRFAYVNARAEEQLATPRAGLLGRVIWDALPALRDAPDYDLLRLAHRDRVPVAYELASLLHPGLWFEIRAVPQDSGAAAGGLLIHLRDVTARKKDETERDLLADLLRHSQDAVIVRETDGTVVSFNPAAERLYGYTDAEARGRRTHELLRTRFLAGRGAVEAALRERGAWGGELFQTRKDGTGVVVASRQSVRRGAAGAEDEQQSSLVLESNRDVTEERRTRQKLEESLARLTFHVENTPLAVIEMDSDLRVVAWSGQAEAIFGWSAAEVLGRHLDEWPFVHEEDAATTLEEVTRLLSGEVDHSMHVNRNYTRDGIPRLMQWNNSVLHDDSGRAVSLLSLGLDLTEQFEVEQALRSSVDALLLSEERYHSLVEASSAVVWTTDPEGRFVEPQASWARYTGQNWPAHEGFGWADMLHPEDRDGFLSRWHRMLGAADRAGRIYEAETRLYNAAAGRHRYCLARLVPLRGPDGAAVREWVGTVADIDERRRAEAERAEFAAKQTQIAETLQRSLLLAPSPDALPGVDLFTLYEPASDEAMVGGDFFDAFAAGGDGERVILVVGDVTGKGLRAAAETAEVKFALRAYLREYPWPQVALSRLNDYLLERQRLEGKPTDVFISLAVAVLDRRSGSGTVAAAGMEPPLLFRAAGGREGAAPWVEEIPARGLMLGALPEWEGDAVPFTMGPRDLLLLCSDGVTEARPFRGSRGIFGIDGVARAALASLGQHSAFDTPPPTLDTLGHAVVEAARAFAGGRLQDDACLLLARRRPDAL